MDERLTRTLGQLRDQEVMGQRSDVLRLRVDEQGKAPRELGLVGPRCSVGAHPAADLHIEDGLVSAIHCELCSQGGRVVVRDLGSKNGTWVADAGIRVHEAELHPGARISVGHCTLTVLGVDDRQVPTSMDDRFGRLLGVGGKMGELFALLSRVASVDIDVLVTGETGTGKELVAQSIHAESSRSTGPLVVFDSTNISRDLAESELFGHRRGAFTGAVEDRVGLFQAAHGGTLFIDEVGELPLDVQAKLLRALEARTTRRVGDTAHERFDARIVAATHRDLPAMVAEGSFREDLYFRLIQVHVPIPALRERGGGNISMLADRFLAEVAEVRSESVPLSFERSAYRALEEHAWPGNVRELRTVVRSSGLLASGPTLGPADLRFVRHVGGRSTSVTAKPLKEARRDFERSYIEQLLEETGGNRTEAAARAGVSRGSFSDILKRLGFR